MATVTAKGQITIPKGIRQALGIDRNDRLVFLLEGDRLILNLCVIAPWASSTGRCRRPDPTPDMRRFARRCAASGEKSWPEASNETR